MDLESENNGCTNQESETSVQTLQATLFPLKPTNSTSYFANFIIKTNGEEEDLRFKIRESPSKEWFPNNKEVPFDVQPPRWPTECQVLEERVKHIIDSPPSYEPYYVPTGNECQPKPSGEECGKVVFQYTPLSAVNYFSRSSVGGNKFILPSNLYPDEDTLKFESRFESGNLAKAIMITPNYYELQLRSDFYTNRHMQWFYFKVSNVKKGFLYRFSITNCSKENSLYNEGMKPLMYSKKDSQLHCIGWRRCGQNISYFCNDNVSVDDPDQQMTYTLTFTVKFPHDDDEVYLAQSYPYTYSDLQDYLLDLSTHPVKSTFTTIRLLCKTLAGNNVQYVTITSSSVPGEPPKKKRAIVISARVHPGETPSSWIMKGIMDFLSSDCSSAKELRDKFIFKIVPMLNPDGVIVGNNRCSLSAKDLNRQYRTVIRDAYPSIWYTKLMIRRLLEECGVAMYCDLHAHSRKHNIFIYGCENRRGSEKKLHEQVFPLMLHKNAADKFCFESCKFKIQKNKEGTGRVVMWMMGIANSYTLETSLAGSTLGARADTHFSIQDFEQMGKTFCQTLLDFYDEDPKKEKLRVKIVERLTKEGSNAEEPMNIKLSDYSSDDGDTSNSSDEVGRDYDYEEDVQLPTVPPCSPVVLLKKSRSKTSRKTGQQNIPRSPTVPRKPLPICKAILKLSLSDKDSTNSESDDSESDSEKTKTKRSKKKRKKKYSKKKKKNKDLPEEDDIIVIEFEPIQKYSENEISRTKRSISVFDLIPTEALKNHIFTTPSRNKIQQTIKHGKKNNEIDKQLTEVQAKLFTLKNKLWFGVGNGDTTLSWGRRSLTDNQKKSYKDSKKSTTCKKYQRNNERKSSGTSKKDIEENSKSSEIGFKGKTLVNLVDPKGRLRKSKSLPDASSFENIHRTSASADEEKTDAKKKKKKNMKLVKKVKVINNVKNFIRKAD
ncbi:cytosolic carboxypeptidase Nna1-like isoform X3 [Diorhabda sublineata]|uniref:cytosolic carboxypeptidase Nna1-like isoform X3 n=1 Tax=Diorhabda sublineata TaxID=1163346 RepID=UPI0024E07A68|nr:cytosolic carboxypeptidase Nna1-like isoform X3 [Diorhabda sublineata]